MTGRTFGDGLDGRAAGRLQKEVTKLPDPYLSHETKGLRVEVPTANYLLALKARACREPIPGASVDEADLRFLIRKMALNSIREVEDQLDKYFPEDPLRPSARSLIERIIEEEKDERKKAKD